MTRSFGVFLICAWTNGWVNNPYAGDLRRHRAHNDVIVMKAYRLKSKNTMTPKSRTFPCEFSSTLAIFMYIWAISWNVGFSIDLLRNICDITKCTKTLDITEHTLSTFFIFFVCDTPQVTESMTFILLSFVSKMWISCENQRERQCSIAFWACDCNRYWRLTASQNSSGYNLFLLSKTSWTRSQSRRGDFIPTA